MDVVGGYRGGMSQGRLRLICLAISAAVLVLPLAFIALIPDPLEQPLGVDFQLYRDAAARWLATGAFFEPRQLAGPYTIEAGDILYPPVGLWLFVPFALLPSPLAWILWFVPPVGITAWALWRLRPRPEVWPLLALCIVWPTTLLKTWTGNPVVWSMAAMALGALYYWPSVFVLLKPSLAPFALFGANRRSWWFALGVFLLMCLPFGSLWIDWVTSVVTSRGGGPLYSSLEAPMLLLPLVARVGRTRRTGEHSTQPASSRVSAGVE